LRTILPCLFKIKFMTKLFLNYLLNWDYLILFSYEIIFDDVEGFFHVRPSHSHEDQDRIRNHEKPHHFGTGVGPEPISETLILIIAQISQIRLLRCDFSVASIMTTLTTFIFVVSALLHADYIAIICKYWFQCIV